MNRKRRSGAFILSALTLSCLLFLSYSPAVSQTLNEIHKLALKEGGTFNFYGTMAQVNAEKILPAFEKRFPGIKINHVDATADKLVARAVAEARGGKTLGDVFQTNLENVGQMYEQALLLDKIPPEANAYPGNLKGTYWVSTDLQFIVAAWNTNLVKKEEEPKQFEDFAEPRWKNRIIAEPRDLELLLGLARYKYKSDEKAIALLKRIAANNVEFHKGHSDLAELLVAGQAAVCLTCYAHHYPPRIKKGAPVNFMRSEGIANLQAVSVFKEAPHPNTAWLWARWILTEEGQKTMALGGRTPSHPKVESVDNLRPTRLYALNVADYKEFPKYAKIWKEIFQIR
jgi:iron(III) transport system substrate-binding protein